jgi:phosphohistidine phosphatase
LAAFYCLVHSSEPKPILRLLLLRHAKSDRDKDVDDHERPLSARGRKAAPKIAAHIREKRYEPAVVLSSSSKRTKETVDLLLPEWKRKPKIRYERALYLADWPRLLEAVRTQKADASPLMIVGHNPGTEQLAIALALQPKTAAERARAQRMAQKFPTAALAVLDFDVPDWRSIKPGEGRLIDYVRPKDLETPAKANDA